MPRPNGSPRLARSQLLKAMRRLVTTATGTIGRPEERARVTMPLPQMRAIFGTSAVITTISPSASARSMARSAAAPPLWRGSRPRAPEPRMARMPRCRSAMALNSPSAERDTRLAARSCRPLGEMDHEMLAVPHGGDDRHERPDAVIGVGRLHDEAVGALNEAEIAREQESETLLHRRGCG